MKKSSVLISLILACVMGLSSAMITSCNVKRPSDGADTPTDETEWELFTPFYSNQGKVGYSAKVLGTVPRQTPEVSDGGLEQYPVYGVELYGSGTDVNPDEKAALLAENTQICAGETTYDAMDENGNLYLQGQPTGAKLYKHTAATGMYLGDVEDNEPALIKEVTVQARRSGNHITGLYAPAGEIIKIEMSEADLERTGGITVEIGQALSNGQANNIWAAREFNRMPVILNTMTVSSTTGYVGSYLGGPIYVKPKNAGTQFTVKITGGVAYSHFILGYTTKEEFEENSLSSAPYFDLEVWDDSVRFSGPKSYAEGFSYEQLTDSAQLWEKISSVSNQVPSGSADIGINFLFDCFVAAGAAVAFVGRNTVNCPLSWMTSCLDYASFVKSGAWGNIHEYNHHYQRYGFAPGDEVTNNAVSLVSYSLFTAISSARTESGGLSGWNTYTDPAWVLKKTLTTAQGDTVNSDLDSYANILHSFGQDAFLKATQLGQGAGGADVWYKALSHATGHDMTYYFAELLHQTVSQTAIDEVKACNYPTYIPVATVYQTGGSYINGSQTVWYETARPFKINRGTPTTLNFNEQLILPEGFSYTIKSLSSPDSGTLEKTGEGVYVYTPDPAQELSGKMYLTLGISCNDGTFEVEDKVLTIELEQGADDNIIQRTVYTYSDNIYSTAEEAYGNGYSGYESVTVESNINRVQDGNAEVWEPNPSTNAVMELSGKIYVETDGRYRIALRGRRSVALYTSTDGVNYTQTATLINTVGDANYHLEDENSYADLTLNGGQYLYFKAVLLVDYYRAYIGVGWGKFNGDRVTVQHLSGALRCEAEADRVFTSENVYPRNYVAEVDIAHQTYQTLIETNYSPWTSGYEEGYFSINNLFDGDKTNFIHSDKTDITAENPFEMTVDLGQTVFANRLTIVGEPTRQYLPKNFILYGGESLDDMHVLAEVTGSTITNNNVYVDFEECSLRYYKLVVSDTHASGTKYIAMRGLEFSYSLSGGRLCSPYSDAFTCRGDWRLENTLSTFGRLYSGVNASMSFEFSGERFAVYSLFSQAYDGFEVYIDGEKVDTVSLKGNDGINLSYLSPKLAEGTHTVLIKSNTPFNIDSIGLW
ncbi:MAG: M60 family metallopeptidase [Candidatus Coproplasma sp.]